MLLEVADLNPKQVEIGERFQRKYELENELFDAERYAFDNYDEEALENVKQIIDMPIEKQFEKLMVEESEFSEKEKEALIRLQKGEILVSEKEN